VTTIVEDNKELCQIDLGSPSDNSTTQTVTKNNGTNTEDVNKVKPNSQTINNFNINNGVINSAVINVKPSTETKKDTGTSTNRIPKNHRTRNIDTERAAENTRTKNVDTSENFNTDTEKVKKPKEESTDVVIYNPNIAAVKENNVKDGTTDNSDNKEYNKNIGSINKGYINESNANNGIISVGTVNNGSTNYGTVNNYEDNGVRVAHNDINLNDFIISVDKMYNALLEGFPRRHGKVQ